MSEFNTPHVSIIGTHVGETGGFHTYKFTNKETGAEETTTSTYAPADMDRLLNVDLNQPNEKGEIPGRELVNTLGPIFRKLKTQDQRNFIDRGIKPILRSPLAYLAGGPADIATLLSYIPGPDELAAMGYEAVTGDTPAFLERSRKGAASLREAVEPYGFKAQQKRFEAYLRQADAYAEDKWGFRPFGDTIGTDMTPEARGLLEKMIVSGLEFGASGVPMAKGVLIPLKVGQGLVRGAADIYKKLARESVEELGEAATSPENVRSLIDKANDLYSLRTEQGVRNIRGEVLFGAAAGPFTEASLAALESVDPDASGHLKTLVAIGSGIIGPVATRGALTTFLQGPVVGLERRAVWDPFFNPETTAARFTRTEGLGPTGLDSKQIASVGRLLEEAIADGRHVDQAAGLVFTTPELSRTEANILRAEIDLKRDELAAATDPAVKKRLTAEIEESAELVGSLNRYANFQESILSSAAKDTSPGATQKFWQAEANRLAERRGQFFNYIENQFKKAFDEIDFGGSVGGTPGEISADYDSVINSGTQPEFEVNRRRLVMEGNIKGIEPSEYQFLTPQMTEKSNAAFSDLNANMERAFDEARKSANERVDFWRRSVDSHLAQRGLKSVDELPQAEQVLVGDLIRGTYDDALREFRGFEKAAYRRVEGIDDKVTENIVFPKGSKDPVTGDSIAGMEVSEWAADRLDKLTPSELFNPRDVPIQLAQLAGMRSVIGLLNRRQKEAVASGRASQAEAQIPALERTRNDAIARRQEVEARINRQAELDRVTSEKEVRSLNTYVESATANLDDAQVAEVNAFLNDPDIQWETLNQTIARGRTSTKELKPIFASIARQKKIISELGEGTKVSNEMRTLNDQLLSISKKADDAQTQINKITDTFLGDMDGAPIASTGRLTARNADGDLVAGGTSPEDVKQTISDIAEAARREFATNGKTPKYRSLVQLRDTLGQLQSAEVFPGLDSVALAFAKEASVLKHRLDDAQGKVLGKDRGSGVKVEVEAAPADILPETSSIPAQATNLRLLQTATADTPDFVTINRDASGRPVTDAEGVPVAVIDETALTGDSLFDLPGSPFEKVTVGETGGFSEIRLRPDAPVTDRSLQLAESILLERLALQFPEGVDSKQLSSFRTNNKSAIQFLKDNGRETVPTLLDDADSLSTQLDALRNLYDTKTRDHLTELVNSGRISLEGATIDDYIEQLGQNRKRIAESNAFGDLIQADPGYVTRGLFDRLLASGNTKPTADLQEFLAAVRGNPLADKGFKASIVAELFRRSLSVSDESIKGLGNLTGSGVFDPTKFRQVMRDPKIRMMLQEVFPDNGDFIRGLDQVAEVAYETANFTRGRGGANVDLSPQDALSLEAYGNLGRIFGLNVAQRVDWMNSLVAAGIFGRAGTRVGKNLTGSKVKDILVEAALDPAKGAALSAKTSNYTEGFFKTLLRASIDTVTAPVTVPMRRPAATVPILLRGQEELGEETPSSPQSSLELAPPTMASRMPPPRPPVSGSTLDRANPLQFAGASTPSGPPNPEIMAGLDQLGMPLFASKGGLASIKKKKKSRQMVY